MENVRYSEVHMPMQTSTGPPGEWGRRASAMSHTILQRRQESERIADMFVRTDTLTRTHAPLCADVLRGGGVTADTGNLDLGDLLHLQTQVLPFDRHPCPPLPRSRQRRYLQGRGQRSIDYQLSILYTQITDLYSKIIYTCNQRTF